MSDDIPIIKPIKLKEYEVKQSKYNIASKLPIRSIILGPSGSGKSILLQNMILDIYKNCFSRVFIFSPSINVDYQTWEPVKNIWIKKLMMEIKMIFFILTITTKKDYLK